MFDSRRYLKKCSRPNRNFSYSLHRNMPPLLPGSPPASPPSSPDSHGPNEQDAFPDAAKLRSVHSTAGYRNGISESKTAKLQQGFDEGYVLGAEIGALAGRILGVVEGVGSLRLRERANEELSLKELFGSSYFNENGTWKWDVTSVNGREGKEGNLGEGVMMRDVARSHPLVRRWTAVVEELGRRTGSDLDAFARDS